MRGQFTAPTTYFLQEGRENLSECLRIAFNAAKQQNVKKIVIFTATGEGVRLALETFSVQPEYEHIQFIAVTFPEGKYFTDELGKPLRVEFPADEKTFFESKGIPVIKAHSPFDPVTTLGRQRGVLGQDWSLIGDAFDVLCGGMSLCVQAILLACDSGAIGLREHVIALSSDTAILAQAASTGRMLQELVVREILCKPVVLTISRKEIAESTPTQMEFTVPVTTQKQIEDRADNPQLQSGTDDSKK